MSVFLFWNLFSTDFSKLCLLIYLHNGQNIYLGDDCIHVLYSRNDEMDSKGDCSGCLPISVGERGTSVSQYSGNFWLIEQMKVMEEPELWIKLKSSQKLAQKWLDEN